MPKGMEVDKVIIELTFRKKKSGNKVFKFVGYGNPERVPPPGVAPAGNGLGVPGAGAGAAGPGGPGPQRGGGHHHQPSQSQYHPYRRGGV